MVPESFMDPMRLWREAVTRLEAEFNAVSNREMKSDAFAQGLHQFVSASVAMQQYMEKMVGEMQRHLNVASRTDAAEMLASLRRVEERLDRLVPPEIVGRPRPTRTRRPPGEHAVNPAPAPTKSLGSDAKSARRLTSSAASKPTRKRKPAQG
jgi:hypothetical protein